MAAVANTAIIKADEQEQSGLLTTAESNLHYCSPLDKMLWTIANKDEQRQSCLVTVMTSKKVVLDGILTFLSCDGSELVSLAGTCHKLRKVVERYCGPHISAYNSMIPAEKRGIFGMRTRCSRVTLRERVSRITPLPLSCLAWELCNIRRDSIALKMRRQAADKNRLAQANLVTVMAKKKVKCSILTCLPDRPPIGRMSIHQRQDTARLEPFIQRGELIGYTNHIMKFFSRSEASQLKLVCSAFRDAVDSYYYPKVVAFDGLPFWKSHPGRQLISNNWLGGHIDRLRCRQTLPSGGLRPPSSIWRFSQMMAFRLLEISFTTHDEENGEEENEFTSVAFPWVHAIDASTVFITYTVTDFNDNYSSAAVRWNLDTNESEYLPMALNDVGRQSTILCNHKGNKRIITFQRFGFDKFSLQVYSKKRGRSVVRNFEGPELGALSDKFKNHRWSLTATGDGNSIKYCCWAKGKVFVGNLAADGGNLVPQEPDVEFECGCNFWATTATMAICKKKWLLINFLSTGWLDCQSTIAVVDLEANTLASWTVNDNLCSGYFWAQADPTDSTTLFAMGCTIVNGEKFFNGQLIRFELNDFTGQLALTDTFRIDGFEQCRTPSCPDDVPQMLQVDFATETVLVSDGRSLFVCNGRNGAVKRKHALNPDPNERQVVTPSFAIIPGRNMFALCRGYAHISLHFLNEW